MPVADGEPGAPRPRRLLSTALYDVWVVTWPDGSGEDYHGHGGVRSVLYVMEGELIEIYCDDVDELAPGARVLRTGDSICAKPSFAHDLANRGGVDATTLHVYSPPLLRVTTVEPPSAGESERLRSMAAGRRFRQAPLTTSPPFGCPPWPSFTPRTPAPAIHSPGPPLNPNRRPLPSRDRSRRGRPSVAGARSLGQYQPGIFRFFELDLDGGEIRPQPGHGLIVKGRGQ